MKKRILSILMSVCVLANIMPISAFANQLAECNHVHDELCGYVAQTEETACDKECQPTEEGVIIHAEDCAYATAIEGIPCTHQHDENCGYTEIVDEEKEEPICSCETKCTEEAINTECAVCSAENADLAGCIGTKETDDEQPAEPIAELQEQISYAVAPITETEEVHMHCVCGSKTCGTENGHNQNQVWLPWAGGSNRPDYAYLKADVVATDCENIAGDSICLNGKVYRSGESVTMSAFELNSQARTSNITDCKDTQHKFEVSAGGLWVLNEETGTEVVTGGVITGFKETAISVSKSGCTLNMYGGNIVGNSTSYGGAISTGDKDTLNIYDGTIQGNYASSYGGGVYSGQGSTMNMYGGRISNNISNHGAGVYTNTFNMYGGAIENNIGDGIYWNGSNLTLEGNISISGNKTADGSADCNIFMYWYNNTPPGSPKAYIIIGKTGLANTKRIGITARNVPNTITNYTDVDYSNKFVSDNKTYSIGCQENNDNKYRVILKNDPTPVPGAVIYNNADNGSFSVKVDETEVASGTVVEIGKTVTVNPVPATGYVVDTVKYNTTELTETNGVYTFAMPEKDVTITVTFKAIEYPVWVGGAQFTSANMTINGDEGTATLTVVGQENASPSYVLTLDNFKYSGIGSLAYEQNDNKYNAAIVANKNLTIVLKGTNSIACRNGAGSNIRGYYGIYAEEDLNISDTDGNKWDSILIAEGTESAFNKAPVFTDDNIFVYTVDSSGEPKELNKGAEASFTDNSYVKISPQEYYIWIGNTQITAANKDDITAAINADPESTARGQATYDPATKTLTLRNFSYSGPSVNFDDGNALYTIPFYAMDDDDTFTFKFYGNNTLSCTDDVALCGYMGCEKIAESGTSGSSLTFMFAGSETGIPTAGSGVKIKKGISDKTLQDGTPLTYVKFYSEQPTEDSDSAPTPVPEKTPETKVPTLVPTTTPTQASAVIPNLTPSVTAKPTEEIGEVIVQEREGLLDFGGVLVQTADELMEILVSEEDKETLAEGQDIVIFLENTDISASVTEEDKQLVADVVNGIDNAQVGVYLDINLFKQIGTSEAEKITNTSKPIVISVEIPQELINTNENVQRTYYIVRIHNGQTDIIEGEFDAATGQFIFETDRFSTYAIIYTDVVTETVEKTEATEIIETTETASTPQQTTFPWWIVIAVVAVAVVAIVVKKKNDKK